ncbi:MAG: RCC1 domain-containing protein [Acidimicrobiales bacterium]
MRAVGAATFLLAAVSLAPSMSSPAAADSSKTGHLAFDWGNPPSGVNAADVYSPQVSPGGLPYTAISAGGHRLALDASGHAWAWGLNDHGQLGNGTTGYVYPALSDLVRVPVPVPVAVPNSGTLRAISAGWLHSLALDSSGRAWAWGDNGFGELGTGTKTDSSLPLRVSMPPGVTFTAISAGYSHSVALDSSGRAWAWGWGGNGQLGDGTQTSSTVPVPVSMPAGVTFTAVVANVGSFEMYSVALDSTGAAWMWGVTPGSTINMYPHFSTVPVQVSMPAGVTFTAISAAASTVVALDTAGRAWAWGNGPLGSVSAAVSLTPVAVTMPAGVTFTAVSVGYWHVLAIDSTGNGWAWGGNPYGELGIGRQTGLRTCTNSQGNFSFPCTLVPTAVVMPHGVTFSAISAGIGISLALEQGCCRT